MVEIARAITLQEIDEIQRLRYSVLVEEMGRYTGIADHENRRLREPEDDHGWMFYAREGDAVVGCMRITWGGDGFSDRQIRQYALEPFLAELPPSVLAVGERGVVAQAARGTELLFQMGVLAAETMSEHGVRVVFGACEPHLLSFYADCQRPYAQRNINTPEAGYLIPIISFPEGPESLTGVGTGPGIPRCVQEVIKGTGAVSGSLLGDPEDYWTTVGSALTRLPGTSLFDGLTDEETRRCIARSNVIECARGDRVLKKGGAARNVFLVLEGALEVLDRGRSFAELGPGDVFGETAFLLRQPRSFDVDVVVDRTRILSLSERTLRSLIANDPVVASKLLASIARTLSTRLSRRPAGADYAG